MCCVDNYSTLTREMCRLSYLGSRNKNNYGTNNNIMINILIIISKAYSTVVYYYVLKAEMQQIISVPPISCYTLKMYIVDLIFSLIFLLLLRLYLCRVVLQYKGLKI